MSDQKITFKRTDEATGETMVLVDGDRLGFVRRSGEEWWATDTYFVGLPRAFKTRGNAVKGLLRRREGP